MFGMHVVNNVLIADPFEFLDFQKNHLCSDLKNSIIDWPTDDEKLNIHNWNGHEMKWPQIE